MDDNPYLATAATCADLSAHNTGAICHDENLHHDSAKAAGRADPEAMFAKIHCELTAK